MPFCGHGSAGLISPKFFFSFCYALASAFLCLSGFCLYLWGGFGFLPEGKQTVLLVRCLLHIWGRKNSFPWVESPHVPRATKFPWECTSRFPCPQCPKKSRSQIQFQSPLWSLSPFPTQLIRKPSSTGMPLSHSQEHRPLDRLCAAPHSESNLERNTTSLIGES